MYDLIIRDATIIRSDGRLVADIAVEDGLIAEVGNLTSGRARQEFSGIGRFVIPGLVDTQVRARTPGTLEGPDWGAATRAAAASGVTALIDLPDAEVTDPVADLEARLAAAEGRAVVDYGAWAAAPADLLDDAGPLLSAMEGVAAVGAVLRLDDPALPWAADDAALAAALDALPGIVGVHAEDAAVLERAARKWEEVDDPVDNDVRPPKAALAAVKRLIAVVRERPESRRVHVLGLSTAGELNALDPWRGDLPITAGITPAHLFLSVESTERLRRVLKARPPVRTELDRRALWAAVKRGRVDCFASGHVPRSLPARGTSYWAMPPGLPGVDTLYPLLVGAVKNARLSMERFVEMACERPARLFGLVGKGAIEPGRDADIVLFSEGVTTRLRRALPLSGVDWSPYIGREVGVAPEMVIAGGRIVAREGALADDPGAGRPVRLGPRP